MAAVYSFCSVITEPADIALVFTQLWIINYQMIPSEAHDTKRK